METTTTPITSVVTRNIKLGILDSGLSQNALAVKSGLSPTTFDRKLKHRPETFTVEELGRIAETLGSRLEDLIKQNAA